MLPSGALGHWTAAVLFSALLLLPEHLDAAPVERPDGSVEVVIDGAPVILPASLGSQVAAAVAEHGNDPEELASVLEDLMNAVACDSATSCASLAAAVVVFAVSKSNGGADVIEAIVSSVAAAVPETQVETLLGAVGVTDERQEDSAASAQQTMEPPLSASPTE